MEMYSQTRRGSVPHVYEDLQADAEVNDVNQTTALPAVYDEERGGHHPGEYPDPPTHNLTINSDQNGSDYMVPMTDQRFEKLTTKLRHQKIYVIISIVVALLSTAGLVAYIFYSLGVIGSLTNNHRDITEEAENQAEQIENLTGMIDGQTEMIEGLTGRMEELTGRVEDLTGKLINLTARHDLAHPEDCHSLWEQGLRTSGVYTIWFRPGYGSEVRCDFDKSNGWTTIQRRFDGSVDFFRDWDSYKTGFGDPETEYWLGNDNIYYLTRTNRKLSIYLRNYMGEEGTANYSTFYINNEGDNYRLTISGYSGSVEDQMAIHNNYQFSTRDRDNDRSSANCAVQFTGAWWYDDCYNANLNGVWTNSSSGYLTNMVWGGSWSGGGFRPLQRCTIRVTRD